MQDIRLVIYSCHSYPTNMLCCLPTWFSPPHRTLWEVPQATSMPRYTYLPLESLTHSLTGHHLETAINLTCLGKHVYFWWDKQGEGEFEDKSEKLSIPHDANFYYFLNFL